MITSVYVCACTRRYKEQERQTLDTQTDNFIIQRFRFWHEWLEDNLSLEEKIKQSVTNNNTMNNINHNIKIKGDENQTKSAYYKSQTQLKQTYF